MKKNLVITQSNYIPWKGYFDSILLADEFIFLDEVQYTKRDWRNRNIIKTPKGPQWLTIPVVVSGQFHQTIRDTLVADAKWNQQHWKTIQQNYSKAPFFKDYKSFFEDLYLSEQSSYLSEINYKFIDSICKLLKISTPLKWSSDYQSSPEKSQRLVDICIQAKATDYYTGPAAKDYMDESLFHKASIQTHYFNYSDYPTYKQLYSDFDHAVSIIDLIMNMGPASLDYLKYSERIKNEKMD